ncbi:MAG: hypothetical protein ACNYPH_06990 [Gammaproteobacteria bacterium WSBS_2016_MAG_OTU1]
MNSRPPFRRRRKTAQSMQRAMFRRPPPCPLLSSGVTEVDYKDVDLLGRYLTDEARIMPSATSNVSARMQRSNFNALLNKHGFWHWCHMREHML